MANQLKKEILANINKYGILKNNKYLATIIFNELPTSGGKHYMKDARRGNVSEENKFFTVRCDSVQIPGMYFQSSSGSTGRLGYGPIEQFPYMSVMEPISLTLINDSDSRVYRMMYDWMNVIVNFQGKGGVDLTAPNGPARHHAYEVGYRDRYACTLKIEVFDVTGNNTINVTAYNAFPTTIQPVGLDWSNHEFMQIATSFTYTDYTIEYPNLNPVKTPGAH
jgi:hypothetical protein